MNTQLSPVMENFSKFIQNNRGQVSPQVFAEEFGKVQRQYLAAKQKDTFCSEAEILAGRMVESQNNDFAGIILSSLCKITQYIPELLEGFAQKGFRVAEANGDPVHMMARLNDLRKIYYRRPDKLYQYIQVLYKQEKCLKELTRNYDRAVSSYQTVSRQAAPKRDYELMLAHVQTEIGKITKRKHPHDAEAKLLSARETFEKRGYRQNVEYIEMLLNEIKSA
ncbi:MAG: hypothetical protein NC408_04225 [Candidatus Gastranaerophilales bacterium]|nr:hypothetical protein [Candidatus Gastranaerophilales bacterium]MCM1073308.1 hypothetical protein [Bacteroides sp.]